MVQISGLSENPLLALIPEVKFENRAFVFSASLQGNTKLRTIFKSKMKEYDSLRCQSCFSKTVKTEFISAI